MYLTRTGTVGNAMHCELTATASNERRQTERIGSMPLTNGTRPVIKGVFGGYTR